MTGLPKGWALATVHELAETSLGKMLDAKQQTGAHPTPYLRNVNVRWGIFDLSDIAEMDVAPHELERVLAQPGDVIACEGGEPGRAAVWRGEPIAIQKALHRIRPAVGISPDYLAYGFRAAASTKQLDRLFTGTTIKHLPQEKLRRVQIPVAPTAEQDRIVSAIEEAFSKLDAGEAGLRTVRQLLKRMRDAILAAAVTGRLVPQDPADAPAAKLLADLGVEVRDGRGSGSRTPDAWCWATIGGLVEPRRKVAYGVLQPGPDVEDGVPLVRVTDIGDGSIATDRLKKIAPAIAAKFPRTMLFGGEVLLTVVGTIGRVAVVPASLNGANVARAVAVLPLRTDVVSAPWIGHSLGHAPWRRALEAAAHEVARKTLNLEDVRRFVVPVPPLREQARIVAEVERQFSFVDACERAVDVAQARSAGVRRSVLKAAFEGRLVPQDPMDEPASVLLDRIRVERAAQPVAKRRARQTA